MVVVVIVCTVVGVVMMGSVFDVGVVVVTKILVIVQISDSGGYSTGCHHIYDSNTSSLLLVVVIMVVVVVVVMMVVVTVLSNALHCCKIMLSTQENKVGGGRSCVHD